MGYERMSTLARSNVYDDDVPASRTLATASGQHTSFNNVSLSTCVRALVFEFTSQSTI